MKLKFNLLPSTIENLKFIPKRDNFVKAKPSERATRELKENLYKIKTVRMYDEIYVTGAEEDKHLILKLSGYSDWWDASYFSPILRYKHL